MFEDCLFDKKQEQDRKKAKDLIFFPLFDEM
jgi:hypothetical protein